MYKYIRIKWGKGIMVGAQQQRQQLSTIKILNKKPGS